MSQIQTVLLPAAPPLPREELLLEIGQLNVFFPILQRGVTVPAVVGGTLKSLLCDQFSIPADYVTDRITTIFLDNRPVDDLEHTLIRNDSRVTLSAAMPGLVGATMRRGGFYAALRGGISHGTDNDTASNNNSGTIRLKLFNLLLAELGPLILARGLILTPQERFELLSNLPDQPASDSANAAQSLVTVTFRE